MDLIDTPPLRRDGEKNFTGCGYDWGENSHILPGRRRGEPNYRAPDKRTLLRPDLNEHAGHERAHCTSGNVDRGSKDTLRSLARVIQVLEWMRSRRNDNGTYVPHSANWSTEIIEQIQIMWGHDWLPVLDHGNVPKTYGQCVQPQNENAPRTNHLKKR